MAGVAGVPAGTRLDGRPQTPDLVPPPGDEAVELGFLAVVPHAALAER